MIEWDKLKAMPEARKTSGVRWDELKAMPDVSAIEWDELKRLREKPVYANAIRRANERLAESAKKSGSEYKIGLDETWDMDYDGKSTEELLYELACEKYGIPHDSESYLKRAGKQVLLGNYTDDVTALGTAGQVVLGLTGLDAPADVRDLTYDLSNWEWSWSHVGQTALDALSLLPGVGAIKYADEAGEVAGSALKRLGKAEELPEIAQENPDITRNLPDSLSEAEQNYINKYSDAVNRYIDKSVESQNRYIDTGYGAMNAQIEKIKEVRELTDDEWDAAMGEFLEILDERKAAEGIGEFSSEISSGHITGKLWRDDADKLTEGAGYKTSISKTKTDEILKTPKYSRPDPITYLEKEYIANHATQFKNGVTKISYKAPSGYAGPPGGTFAMPTSGVNDLIARAGGDISELERLLGLDPGDLGANPVRIDIANPSGLRMPSGNEKGANLKWIPGGYTSGGIPEIIIDSPGPGQYTIKSIK